VYAKFRCAPLRIKKALGIFRELITTTTRTKRTTRVAFWDPPSGFKKVFGCVWKDDRDGTAVKSLGNTLQQENPAVADKPARRLRNVCTVYVRAVGL